MPAIYHHDGEKTLNKILTGNEAVSTAVKLARVEVIAAYPITPQTSISEKLSNYCAQGEMDADFIKVESEHSAMACVVGAASAGVRTFTATSSHGLALMHEMLHWASGARLPIVMVNVNRALGSPWNIWCDHGDSISQRDTGWLQFYCASAQEVIDTVLMSFKLAETVYTPTMVMLDGFFLSHTAEQVELPEPELVDKFLPRLENPNAIDPANPRTYHAVTSPEHFQEFKYKQFEGAIDAEQTARKIEQEWGDLTGRRYDALETFMADDAETLIVAKGTSAGTCKYVVRQLREQGRKVGLVRLRQFRPFPEVALKEALGKARTIAVLDQSVSPGSEGAVCQEIKAALYQGNGRPAVHGFVGGLGGRDITPEDITKMVDTAEAGVQPEPGHVNWVGLKA
jgi:pyruvate/2-oxoacid:ferredoxin oxidoreductase alpha subunit